MYYLPVRHQGDCSPSGLRHMLLLRSPPSLDMVCVACMTMMRALLLDLLLVEPLPSLGRVPGLALVTIPGPAGRAPVVLTPTLQHFYFYSFQTNSIIINIIKDLI